MLRHGPKHSTQRPWGHLRSLQGQRKMHRLWRTRTQKPHHEAAALASWRRLEHFHWTRDFSRVLGHSLPTTLEAVTMGRRPADSHQDTTRPVAFASTVPSRHASACGWPVPRHRFFNRVARLPTLPPRQFRKCPLAFRAAMRQHAARSGLCQRPLLSRTTLSLGAVRQFRKCPKRRKGRGTPVPRPFTSLKLRKTTAFSGKPAGSPSPARSAFPYTRAYRRHPRRSCRPQLHHSVPYPWTSTWRPCTDP